MGWNVGKLVVVAGALAGAVGAAWAGKPVGPSDCLAGRADSTCGRPVVGGTPGFDGTFDPPALYRGLLARGPYLTGYEYWGYDFVAARRGVSDLVSLNAFRNASNVPVTIKFSANVPDDPTCQKDCLPAIIFKNGKNFGRYSPKLTVVNGIASASLTVQPGDPYAWIIGLWQQSDINVTVTVPAGSIATLESVGLNEHLEIADAIPPKIYECSCWDGSIAECSIGTRFSNGLMSPWYPKNDGHVAPDAFNDCPTER